MSDLLRSLRGFISAGTSTAVTVASLAMQPGIAAAQRTVPAATNTPDTARWSQVAEVFVRRLERGEHAAASASARKMSPELLRGAWAGLVTQMGRFVDVGEPVVTPNHANFIVDLQARFERASVTMRVVLDSSEHVVGFWVRPPASVAPPAYVAPAYVHRERFVETEIAVGQGPDALPGTLTLPVGHGRVPIVVLVHGSGPSDRDEQHGAHFPFRDLAWGLASRGIGVLRYDKRSFARPQSLSQANVTVEEEVIADALLALRTARAHPLAGSIVLAGHSLGGMLAPEIALRDGQVAAVVLLAGATRPFAETLEEQLRYLASLPAADGGMDPAALTGALPMLAELRARRLAPTAPVLGATAGYVYDLDGRDPLAAARALRVPVLAVHGGRDYQVTEVDAARWREALRANPRARVAEYPALNHLLMPGSGRATPAEYRGAANHVDGALLADLATWVRAAVAAP